MKNAGISSLRLSLSLLLVGLTSGFFSFLIADGKFEETDPFKIWDIDQDDAYWKDWVSSIEKKEYGLDQSAIWAENIQFTHPMTVTTEKELETVRLRIREKIEPQYSAYGKLLKDAEATLAFKSYPPTEMLVMGGYIPNSNNKKATQILKSNSRAAYICALVWKLNGDEKYAEKATEIINAWVKKDTYFHGKDPGLRLGSHFSPMLYAADLIHDYSGWTKEERIAFESFWRRRCLVHTLKYILRENNWGDHALNGVLSAGIVFEDEELIKRCLCRLDDIFYGPWKIRNDHRGTALRLEVIRNDGSSGISYTAYALTSLTFNLDMARNFGAKYDWWERKTTTGASMTDLIEQFFRWDVLGEKFPWYDYEGGGEPNKNRGTSDIFETANNRLVLDPRIGEWLEAKRADPDGSRFLYLTLLKGDLTEADDRVQKQ